MKTIKTHLKKTAVLLSTIILLASCSQYDNSLNNLDSDNIIYSGQEIFEGLFYFQNDISSKISTVKSIKDKIENLDNSTEIYARMSELSEISTTYINQKYPAFFNDLQTAMYSGNLYEIGNEIEVSVKMMEQAMIAHGGFEESLLIRDAIEEDEELKNKMLELDLNNEQGIEEFRSLLLKTGKFENINSKAVFFAGALAVFYIAVAAVSIAVAAYSVITKVAYWDIEKSGVLTSDDLSISKEMAIAEISEFFSSNK